MSTMISKIYDVPVAQNWYELEIEVDRRTAERWIFVEFKVVVDTNDFDEYEFRLFMDGVPLDAYMEEHKQRYNAWIIERLGSKSKLVFDGNQENMFFREQNIETEKTQPSFEVSVWEGKFKEEYTFRIVKTLERMDQFTAILHVNGEENSNEFNPRRG
ncbi:unnamed protein product [Caenorhabditis brenneri]